MNEFIYTTTSKYSDLNPEGFLSNIGFLRIFQEAASLHSASIKYGPADTKNNNCAWIILGWKLKVFKRPNWNKILNVKTYASVFGEMFSFRDFEITDEDGNMVAKASSKWVIVDYQTKHIRRMPEEICKNFVTDNEPIFGSRINIKIKEPESIENTINYKVLRRDLDTNYHVNNLNYIHFAEEALPQNVYDNVDLNNVEIMYKHETRLDDIISINYSSIGNMNNKDGKDHIVTIKTGNDLNAIIKMWEE